MNTTANFEAPWVEKHRPQFLCDIVGNCEAVSRLAAISEVGNLPNIILAGPPGIGKTTSVLCLARQMLGDSYKNAVLELNASDARGIDVVRNKIKMFAQKKVTLPPHRHKLIILDEADSMTNAAQQALRRTMEIYSHTTRFALACNNSTKIIEPIQSRCAVLRYTRLSDAEVLSRLQDVAALENVSYDTAGLEAIVFVAEGDMRNALNSMQSTVSGFGRVSSENVFKVRTLRSHTSHLMPLTRSHTSHLIPGTRYPVLHTSYFILHTIPTSNPHLTFIRIRTPFSHSDLRPATAYEGARCDKKVSVRVGG
jgi:replication factor C subunit 2/4